MLAGLILGSDQQEDDEDLVVVQRVETARWRASDALPASARGEGGFGSSGLGGNGTGGSR